MWIDTSCHNESLRFPVKITTDMFTSGWARVHPRLLNNSGIELNEEARLRETGGSHKSRFVQVQLIVVWQLTRTSALTGGWRFHVQNEWKDQVVCNRDGACATGSIFRHSIPHWTQDILPDQNRPEQLRLVYSIHPSGDVGCPQ